MLKTSITKSMRKNEAGSVALVLMIFLGMAALTLITVTTLRGIGDRRKLDQSRTKLHEKWSARSGANVLSEIVRKDAPRRLQADVRTARERCGIGAEMPVFDNRSITSDWSNPGIVFADGELVCNTENGIKNERGELTSIFGTVSGWGAGRIPGFESTGQRDFQLDAENVKVVDFSEIYRRSIGSTSAEISYAVRFVVESKSGNYRTRANGELILGSALPSCGTRLSLEINPTSVTRGSPVQVSIHYAYASRLDLLNSSGSVVHTANVVEQAAEQVYNYSFSPVINESYSAVASGSGGCQASTPAIVVTVTDPVILCPSILDFSPSSVEINSGETVTINWNVADAAQVVFEGVPVRPVGSQAFTLTADRTFTLMASGESGSCPVSRQITVRVRSAPPSCSLSTPQIQSFIGAPSSVAIGESVGLSWNVSGLASSTVNISGPAGYSYSGAPSGTTSLTPPGSAGDYTYTLRAENVCPDGTRFTAQQNVVIQVRACPPPVIDSFVVSPGTVSSGGASFITFSWSIAGSADAVSISNGVGSGLPASGVIEVPQPQTTTTYTLTSVGCGQTRQAQVTVTVLPPPGFCPVTPGPGQPDAIAGGGVAGRQNLANSNSADAEYRAIFRVSHFSNNTFRFNIQLYYSGMNPHNNMPIIGPQVNGSLNQIEIGKLKVRLEYEGVRFLDENSAQVAFYAWQGRTYDPSSYNPEVGFLTLGLVGNGVDDPGVLINYPAFDFNNDQIRGNAYNTVAYTIPFSSTSFPPTGLNIAIGTPIPSRWRCP